MMEEVGLVVVLPPPATLYRSWRVTLSTISHSLQSMMLGPQSVNQLLLVSEMIQRCVYTRLSQTIMTVQSSSLSVTNCKCSQSHNTAAAATGGVVTVVVVLIIAVTVIVIVILLRSRNFTGTQKKYVISSYNIML